jgi:hypothetical protein
MCNPRLGEVKSQIIQENFVNRQVSLNSQTFIGNIFTASQDWTVSSSPGAFADPKDVNIGMF